MYYSYRYSINSEICYQNGTSSKQIYLLFLVLSVSYTIFNYVPRKRFCIIECWICIL